MLKHLTEVRGIHAENRDKGIYYLIGDAIPMQLLITQELTQEENFWLKNLRMDLKAGREIQNIVAKYEQTLKGLCRCDGPDHAGKLERNGG